MKDVDRRDGIGAALNRIRIEKNLTLEQVAILVGLTPGAVWKIEKGACVPNERSTYRILKAFPELNNSTA